MPTHDDLLQAAAELDALATLQGLDGTLKTLGLTWPEAQLFALRRVRMLGPFPGVAVDPVIEDALALCWLDGIAIGLASQAGSAAREEDLQ